MLRAAALVLVSLVAAVVLIGWASTVRFYIGWRGFPQAGRIEADTGSTTRLFAADDASFAALASRTAYPGGSAAALPGAALLAPLDDWRYAAALVPLGHERNAPILYFEPDRPLPDATRGELERLAVEAQAAGTRLEVVLAGGLPAGGDAVLRLLGADVRQLPGDDPVAVAGALLPNLPHDRIVFVDQARPEFALPALAWAAYSGDALLFVDKSSVPDATRDALLALDEPPQRLYVTVPDKSARSKVTKPLKKYGRAKVTRLHSGHVAGLAVRLATWSDQYGFGWGLPVADANQELLVAREEDDLQVIAALPLLRTSGAGPLLIGGRDRLPTTTASYLWRASPTWRGGRPGPFDHAWIIGDASRVGLRAQGDVEAALTARPWELAGPGLSEIEALALGWALVGFAGAAWALYVVNTRPWAFRSPWRASWPAALVLLGPVGTAAVVWRCLSLRENGAPSLLDRWVAARAFDVGLFVAASFVASVVGVPARTFVPDQFPALGSSLALELAIAGGAAVVGVVLYQSLLPPGSPRAQWWRLALLGGHVAALAAAAWGLWWFQLSYLPLHAVPSATELSWWASMAFAAVLGLMAALPFELIAGLLPGTPFLQEEGRASRLAVIV